MTSPPSPRARSSGSEAPLSAAEPSAAGIVAVDRLGPARHAQLLELFANAWWATRRETAAVERMLAGTEAGAPAHRGTGLGARLMDELLARPELAEVGSVELICQPDLVDFYRRWGFTDRVGRSLLMRRTGDPRIARASS